MSFKYHIQDLLKNFSCHFLHRQIFRIHFWKLLSIPICLLRVVVLFGSIFQNCGFRIFWDHDYFGFVLLMLQELVCVGHWFGKVTQVRHIDESQYFALFTFAHWHTSFPRFLLLNARTLDWNLSFASWVFTSIEWLAATPDLRLKVILCLRLHIHVISLTVVTVIVRVTIVISVWASVVAKALTVLAAVALFQVRLEGALLHLVLVQGVIGVIIKLLLTEVRVFIIVANWPHIFGILHKHERHTLLLILKHTLWLLVPTLRLGALYFALRLLQGGDLAFNELLQLLHIRILH